MLEFTPCSHKWIWSVIFIRIPKNASTSIYSHLGDFNLIKKHEKIFNDALFKNKLYKKCFSPTHAKPNEIYGIFGNLVKNYMSFAIVRNPFDRAVSMFQFAKENKLGDLYNYSNDIAFEDFCEIMEENHANNTKDFLGTHQQIEWLNGAFQPNFILRFENLKNDFKEMLDACEIKHITADIPHENSSKRSDHKDYYNSKTKKIIEKVFEKDIDTFKYLY
jgi:hypothetical protein